MANPILLLVLTICGTVSMGVRPSYARGVSSFPDEEIKRYAIGENSWTSRPPVNHSLDLSLRLLRHLYSPSRNLVFSPYSLVTASTLTLLGADGQSRRQLRVTLVGSKNEHWVEQFITQHSELAKSNAEQLTMANFLYSDKRFPLKSEYLKEIAKSNLSGIAKTLSFADDPSSALEAINSDVSAATRGLIPRLLTELDPSTALLLLNTVTFKGLWKLPFKKANIDLNGTFTKSPGSEKLQIPMMHHYLEKLPCFEESDGTKSLLLPYNVPHLHMALLLPPEGTPIESFLKKLNGTFLDNLTEVFQGAGNSPLRRRVNVALPRFSISSTHSSLVQTLESLGVSDIFSPEKANLSKLTEKYQGLAVDQVIQKATIEVKEDGYRDSPISTAYAALTHLKECNFIADRPFVFAIVYEPCSHKYAFYPPVQTQVLLMGVVEDPSSE